MINEKTELKESARQIKKMRLTLNRIKENVIEQIESTGEGRVPSSWRRKVSSPITPQGLPSFKHSNMFMNTLTRMTGSHTKFNQSYREPHLVKNGSFLLRNTLGEHV